MLDRLVLTAGVGLSDSWQGSEGTGNAHRVSRHVRDERFTAFIHYVLPKPLLIALILAPAARPWNPSHIPYGIAHGFERIMIRLYGSVKLLRVSLRNAKVAFVAAAAPAQRPAIIAPDGGRARYPRQQPMAGGAHLELPE